jgi:hypothetical protein
VTLTRAVVGAPADGWGVAPDGRVAVVRGRPYRVDWIAPDGTVTTGPEIPHGILPMTEADKRAYRAEQAALPSVGVRSMGGGSSLAGLEPEFAQTRAPFSPDAVTVSPDAQVWVKRARPAGATDVVYDVFDSRGRRIARLAFPTGSHVAGFGAGAVFMRSSDPSGGAVLAKYRRP